ncbi:regulatory protein RecX [Rarobacter incanus]|uniref:Regulatory protein RecX n=1 Tax=Rarobacter incanus TaxID=153494 RepID=A0A542SLM7_9MICO|nr:regulatory protein RecX [Rarobacter incanus]TQK75468.1 regulatory protein [Rarobacter incanus]
MTAGTKSKEPVDASDYDGARERALRILTAAPQSTGTILHRLVESGYSDDVARCVTQRLVEVALIDDWAYAAARVRSRRDASGWSRRAVSQELAQKRVPADVRAAVLDAEYPADLEADVAAKAALAMVRKLAGREATEAARAIHARLMRRGFGSGVCQDAVRRAGFDRY